MVDLPYFDLLLAGREQGERASSIFDRYVHWGYWENPRTATKDTQEFVNAMERLNSEILRAADLKDDQIVLDAGCGFGGTLASIQASYKDMDLTGINIDPRQLEIARTEVSGVRFIEADACVLPFESNTFDRVLAVECIFHFPSRALFLKEAARVLKQGGRIALSDFVPSNIEGRKSWIGALIEKQIQKGYGEFSGGWTDGDYEAMAKEAGLRVILNRDITANTLPTYDILQDLFPLTASKKNAHMVWSTRLLKWISKLRLIKYRIVSFEKP